MAKDFNVILGEAQQIKNEIIEGANTANRLGTCLEDIVQRAEVDEAAAAKNTTEIVAGDGLTGGGTIAQNRTISVGATDDSVVVGADGIKVDTQDNLTSTSPTKPLSANQGKVLNEKVVQVETDLNLDEYTIAEAFNLLYRKLVSLETIIANGVFKSLQVDNLTTVNSFNYNGAPLIVMGTTAPASAPDFVGQTYVNTTAPGTVYSAKGISSVSDWKQTSN